MSEFDPHTQSHIELPLVVRSLDVFFQQQLATRTGEALPVEFADEPIYSSVDEVLAVSGFDPERENKEIAELNQLWELEM